MVCTLGVFLLQKNILSHDLSQTTLYRMYTAICITLSILQIKQTQTEIKIYIQLLQVLCLQIAVNIFVTY